MKDPRVASALSLWAPRFVSNGVLPADLEDIAGRLERWEDWCKAWSARAAVHEALGKSCLQKELRLSAGEHLVRAALYYHYARFLFVQDERQARAAHIKSVETYHAALALMKPPGEKVEIPLGQRRLQGVLRRPEDNAKPPVLILSPGLGSAKEELHACAEPFLARGIAVLAIDGPGQGEAEYDLPICADYERVARAVVDWIEKQTDLDAARIGIWGVDLGGYYAPRAAAHEKRIKACISVSGAFDWADVWDGLPELTRQAFVARSHSGNESDAKKHAASLTLERSAKSLSCPLFIVAGRQDALVPAAHAERLAKAVCGPVETLIVEDGGHAADNRPYRYRSRTADWLAAQFGMPRS